MKATSEAELQPHAVAFLKQVLRRVQGATGGGLQVLDTSGTSVPGLNQRKPDAVIAPGMELSASLLTSVMEYEKEAVNTSEAAGLIGTQLELAMQAQPTRLRMFGITMAKNMIQLFVAWRHAPHAEVLWAGAKHTPMYTEAHDGAPLSWKPEALKTLGTWVTAALDTDNLAQPPLPVVGPFKMKALLGTGATCHVYRGARNTTQGVQQGEVKEALEGELTIKVARTTRAKRCLVTEAAVLRALTRKAVGGVPTFVKYGEDHEKRVRYLVTKPVGRPLCGLDPMLWTPEHSCQLFDILKDLHYSGYVHGDVRPANIVFHGDGIILVDFGGARRMTDDSVLSYVGSSTTASDAILRCWGLPERRVTPLDDVISAVRTITLLKDEGLRHRCALVPRDAPGAMMEFWAQATGVSKQVEEAVLAAAAEEGAANSIYKVARDCLLGRCPERVTVSGVGVSVGVGVGAGARAASPPPKPTVAAMPQTSGPARARATATSKVAPPTAASFTDA